MAGASFAALLRAAAHTALVDAHVLGAGAEADARIFNARADDVDARLMPCVSVAGCTRNAATINAFRHRDTYELLIVCITKAAADADAADRIDDLAEAALSALFGDERVHALGSPKGYDVGDQFIIDGAARARACEIRIRWEADDVYALRCTGDTELDEVRLHVQETVDPAAPEEDDLVTASVPIKQEEE